MKAKKSPKSKKKRLSVNPKIILAFGVFLMLLALFMFTQSGDKWSVSKDGVLSYPQNRGKVDVRVLKKESSSNYTLETIAFQSKDYTVEALLRIPKSEKKVPAVVILPGATVPKEGTQTLAEIFARMGYASLGIEQRNRGGVDFKGDYELFIQFREPVEHKMVYDALRSVDVLRQDPRIDAEKIAIVGESNGGRFAIIAAAIEPGIKGVIGISTSGYDTESYILMNNIRDETTIRFYRSIDPDTYLGSIPPRKLVMLHAVNDSIIPISMAENTYKKAKEPKQFYAVNASGHGYTGEMREGLEKEMRIMLG